MSLRRFAALQLFVKRLTADSEECGRFLLIAFGTIERIDPWSFIIRGQDGRRYFAYYRALDTFGVAFEDLKLTMPVSFTPAASDRLKDDDRAIMVRVTGAPMVDGV